MNQPTTQSHIAAGVIDLGVGHPGPDLLPLDLMAAAAAHCMSAGDTSFLQYGLEAGSPHLRTLLADFLTQGYACAVEPAALIITNGVSQALDLLCTLHTRPGDVVLVEEPTYFLALRIFADHGLRAVGAPIDDEGLIPAALEERLRREHPRLLYTIPAHQNPTGITLSATRRAQIVELCAAYGCLLVADEVYHLLTYRAGPPPPLANWTDQPHLLSLGTFSKILAPGLRLGWIQAAPAQIERLIGCGLLDSGGGLNPFTGAVVHSVLELDLLSPHVTHLRATYASRMNALAAALHHELGSAAHFDLPAGGYFLWLRLDGQVDPVRLEAAAREKKVGYRLGARFSAQGGFDSHLRLCFAYYGEDELVEGARRLAAAIGRAG